jgi:hypothetical protein
MDRRAQHLIILMQQWNINLLPSDKPASYNIPEEDNHAANPVFVGMLLVIY